MARYYRTDLARNQAVSTEITGYALSTYMYLAEITQQERYLASALAAARFLTRQAWDGRSMPFETAPADRLFSYFFDCGIIVRGLVAAWRVTREPEFLDVAVGVGQSMASDFAAPGGEYHPILSLPGKEPQERDPLRWSRNPGCYQLKAALAWWELSEATGDAQFAEWYERARAAALHGYAAFLPGHPEPLKVVDRLHAFLYFLEGLLPAAADRLCAAALCDGIRRVAHLVAETAAGFERSDVYAQLLRVRIFADWAGVAPLDETAARSEAQTLAAFQAASPDPRIDGGFYFGRQSGAWLPYVNPVSTAFALQALALWDRSQAGSPLPWHLLI